MDWQDKYINKIVQGDCLELMRELPDGCVDCVVTSPPYWGLRDYGLEPVIWDGVDGCQHEWGEIDGGRIIGGHSGGIESSGLSNSAARAAGTGSNNINTSQFCSICGAWRGSLGLEPTFQLYIAHLMQIFDEVKRVLKPTGTCWVNMGDSYISNPGDRSKVGGFQGKASEERIKAESSMSMNKHKTGLRPKSLCQIPSRFAIAMTDAGWILRNTIIWHKRNAMPSSAKDRFTVDYEVVHFFVKQGKYWFEQQTEVGACNKWGKYSNPKYGNSTGGAMQSIKEMTKEEYLEKYQTRNKRCVWDVTTKPFKEAHFATFPPDLVRPMILAGCPPDGIVLDPFDGSGTVQVVCEQEDRDSIGIDLNPEYCAIAEKRIAAERQQLKLDF